MAGMWLFWTLMGPTTAHLLTMPESPIYVSTGNAALLSASLNFSTLVPEYFELRWRFATSGCLVLIIEADNCVAETGIRHWRDSCRINIVKTEKYRHRAELASENPSLVLQNVSAEDSGNYTITLLAFQLMISARISLIVTDGTKLEEFLPTPHQHKSQDELPGLTVHVEAPSLRSRVELPVLMAASARDYKMTNIIQLSLAGVILCLLGLIIAKHISFVHCKKRETETKSEQESIRWYQDGSESTFLPFTGNTLLVLKMPQSENVDGLYYNCNY